LLLWLLSVPAPVSDFQRITDMPVLSPQGKGFESAGTFNPAAIRQGGKIILLYRAQDLKGKSAIGYASSSDGIHFQRAGKPVLEPETSYEKDGGVEDPRVVQIGGKYWLTYTAYNTKDAQLCIASSGDLLHWQRHGVILPAYRGRWNAGWTKSGAILNQKIGGKFWMYFMGDARGHPGQMGVAWSTDLIHWTEPLDRPVLTTRPGFFDARVAEPGPPPILTERGILLIYNGADESIVYRTGWALFDRNDPTRLIARAAKPVFVPEKTWEKVGQVPRVVVVEGMVESGEGWLLYYGAADKYVGAARLKWSD
jgi:predicted GH43/DUF377 family glycosyl hydrolase